MHTTPPRTLSWRHSAVVVGVLALAAACGGGDDDSSSGDTGTTDAMTTDAMTTEAPDTGDDADTTGAPDAGDDAETTVPSDTADEPSGSTEPPAAAEEAGDATSGTYEPGPIGYRVVNSTDLDVDVYVRTTGIVEAFEAQLDVGPGVVTEFFYPPAGGPIVVTTAGADDATCVASCDHILANVSAFDDTGDVFTLVMHDASGRVETLELYEEAPDDVTAANALVAADPTTGQLVAIGVDLTDAEFGVRLGYDGVEGCVDPVDLDGILVGGNQTPAFTYAGEAVDVLLYANDDRECAGEPVGGPFTVEGGAGTRTMLILTGSPGDMDAIILPFMNPVEGGAPGPEDSDDSGDSAASGDAATAYELMADELAFQIGLAGTDAECLSPYVVDAIGLDVALVDGALIDLDAADVETQNRAFDGLITGVEACGIDPTVFGG